MFIRTIVAAVAIVAAPVASTAATFTDRATWEAALTLPVAFTEDFESLATGSPTSVASPLTPPSGISVSSDLESAPFLPLFIAPPGFTGNATTALGSNWPSNARLLVDLGGPFIGFGVDLFQNIGNG